jgi:hypothetical protein
VVVAVGTVAAGTAVGMVAVGAGMVVGGTAVGMAGGGVGMAAGAGPAGAGSSALPHLPSIIRRLRTITHPPRTIRRHTMVTEDTRILQATRTGTLRLQLHYVATLIRRQTPTTAAHRTNQSLVLGRRDSPPY